jgi:hypothetical protein
VSSWRCTRTGCPASTAVTMAARWRTLGTARSIRCPRAVSTSQSTGFSQLNTGASTPAARTATASAIDVTPSHVAPLVSAVLATSASPCPKPSAFTTAISSPRVVVANRRVLAATADRSIAKVGSWTGVYARLISVNRALTPTPPLPPARRWRVRLR